MVIAGTTNECIECVLCNETESAAAYEEALADADRRSVSGNPAASFHSCNVYDVASGSVKPSHSVFCQPVMTPLSWHTGQCQWMGSLPSSSSAMEGMEKMIPAHRRRPGQRRHLTDGGSSMLVVASTTMLAKYSARRRARGGKSVAIAPLGVR